MSTHTYTAEEIVAAIEAAVARTPDAMNPAEGNGCLYTGPEGNHCIAGQVLVDLGFSVPAYVPERMGGLMDDNRATGVAYLVELGGVKGFHCTEDALRVLAGAQVIFDHWTGNNKTWTEALVRFRESLESRAQS